MINLNGTNIRVVAISISLLAAGIASGQTHTVSILANGYSFSVEQATLSGPGAGNSIAFTTYDGSSGSPISCDAAFSFCHWSDEISPSSIGGGTYRADYIAIENSSGHYEYGTVTLQVPTGDSNGNGLPDVLELPLSGSFAMSGSSQCHFPEGDCGPSTISMTVSRAPGNPSGSYSGSYTIQGVQVPFSGSMQIIRAEATGEYEVGGNTLTISGFVLPSGRSFLGVTNFTRVGTTQIQLPAFTLTEPATGLSVTSLPTTLTRSGETYRGLLTLADGDPETAWPDYKDFMFEITDNNDLDNDNIPDLSDTILDTDQDGVPDSVDVFPYDPTETMDTDGDTIGDNADTDDDGDGFSDAEEITAGTDPLNASDFPFVLTEHDFNALGGYQAYLAEEANTDLRLAGICDAETAFANWRDYGYDSGRGFAEGKLRTDNSDGSPDADFDIDGGFSWEYPGANTVVFITADAPKPEGWAGRFLLLERCQTFNLGSHYTAQAYRTINTDVRDAIDTGLIPNFASVTDHYVKYGFKEGRLTNSDWTPAELDAWDDAGYFLQNPDVEIFFNGAQSEGWIAFGKIGFAHWINFGRYEGRSDGQ